MTDIEGCIMLGCIMLIAILVFTTEIYIIPLTVRQLYTSVRVKSPFITEKVKNKPPKSLRLSLCDDAEEERSYDVR